MKLSKKTLLYSVVISVIIVSLIVGYFVLMLPSLYVDYMQERNYDSVVKLQQGFMKDRSYDRLEVKNPTATVTMEIPMTGNEVYLISKYFRITLNLEDQNLLNLLNKIRYYSKHTEELEDVDPEEWNLEEIKDKLLANMTRSDNSFMDVQLEVLQNDNMFREISSEIHVVSDELIIFEGSVTDGQNNYTSYVALGLSEDSVDITFMPMMTPTMDEIRPVIFRSLPMIVAVALLLVLLSSQVFSRMIIIPIIKLANHAQFMKEAKNLKLEPIEVTGRDEISSLSESLNGLYQKIQESYQELSEYNQFLAEENKRQEVFLRASSHQLKTPIAAALLLVQGMIGEVGKYKDVKTYLPEVKKQLVSMQRMVEDILYLNHCSDHLNQECISLSELINECLAAYVVQNEENRLHIAVEGEEMKVETDREVMKKIIDNLLSNAFKYTPEGGRIKISYEADSHRLSIINYGTRIDEELLPHVFEPFVTGENLYRSNSGNRSGGHGLGLYVVAYYAKFLHIKVSLQNVQEGVLVELSFENNC